MIPCTLISCMKTEWRIYYWNKSWVSGYEIGKVHSFKLSCVGGRTLRNDLEHAHIDVLCVYIYMWANIYMLYICLYVYRYLMFFSPVFFKTCSCSYFHGMRHPLFAFILVVVCIMWYFRDLANRKPRLLAWKLLKVEQATAGSALSVNIFLLSLKRITGPLPQSVVTGFWVNASRYGKAICQGGVWQLVLAGTSEHVRRFWGCLDLEGLKEAF